MFYDASVHVQQSQSKAAPWHNNHGRSRQFDPMELMSEMMMPPPEMCGRCGGPCRGNCGGGFYGRPEPSPPGLELMSEVVMLPPGSGGSCGATCTCGGCYAEPAPPTAQPPSPATTAPSSLLTPDQFEQIKAALRALLTPSVVALVPPAKPVAPVQPVTPVVAAPVPQTAPAVVTPAPVPAPSPTKAEKPAMTDEELFAAIKALMST